MNNELNKPTFKRVEKKLKYTILIAFYFVGILSGLFTAGIAYFTRSYIGGNYETLSEFLQGYWWVYFIAIILYISFPFIFIPWKYIASYEAVFLAKTTNRKDMAFKAQMKFTKSKFSYTIAKKLMEKYNFAQEVKNNASFFSEQELKSVNEWEEKMKKFATKINYDD